MAIMIPSLPLDVDLSSKEDYIFNIFKEKLPSNVYICHSLRVVNKTDKSVSQTEIDFIILIPDKGIILVEAKATEVQLEVSFGPETEYLWKYHSGTVMKYNGPFGQINRAKYILLEYLKKDKFKNLNFNNKNLYSYCVCFPDVTQNTIDSWNLPPDADKEIIISMNDLQGSGDKLYNKLLKIIEWRHGNNPNYATLNEEQCKYFINYVLAPTCNLIPSKRFWVDLQNNNMHSFLKEQTMVLDFLEEQNVAVINGAAGTGKTLIAIEKARRLAEQNEKVLFICFNRFLKDYLQQTYKFDNVRYETIDSLAYSYFGEYGKLSYDALVNRISNDYKTNKFPYKHFIIDEAQDFGKPEIENSMFLNIIQEIAEKEDGCCYFFYDKYQLVQSKEVPSVILDADCKISLFKNCRNTQKIASTSYKVFTERELNKRKVIGFQNGESPLSINCDKSNTYESLKRLVNEFKKKGYKDIVILTTKEISDSSIYNFVKNGMVYVDGFGCHFTTCRRFKGLEAEVIILLDIDSSVLLDSSNRLLFYVGASRAKFELGLIMNLTDDEIKTFMKQYNPTTPTFLQNLNGLNVYLGSQKIQE